ncbi:MAG TPA: hypothetical protein VFY99_10780 [Solirubrobacterales bacterium]
MSAEPAAPLDGAMIGLAIGRLTLGAISRLAPAVTARLIGAGPSPGPEWDYMTRIFGIRAIALGTGYLTSAGEARRHWQRLALLCDASDTVAGVGLIRRGEVSRGSALWMTFITGAYSAIGAARVLEDGRGR